MPTFAFYTSCRHSLKVQIAIDRHIYGLRSSFRYFVLAGEIGSFRARLMLLEQIVAVGAAVQNMFLAAQGAGFASM